MVTSYRRSKTSTGKLQNQESLKLRQQIAEVRRRAFVHLEFKRATGAILNWYEVKRNLFIPLISAFIQDRLAEMADV